MTDKLTLLVFAVFVTTVTAQLSYECYPNDTIIVTNPDVTHYIGAYANNSAGQCTATWAGDYTTLTITGCSKSEDILLQLSNRSTSDTILGGSGIYLTIVRCDEIDATGVPRTIVANFSPTLLVTTQGAITPSFSVETILKTGGTVGSGYSDGTVITEADVGTNVKWTLQVPADYYAKLVTCTAYSGTSNAGTPSQQLIVNGCSQDESIVQDWATANSAVVALTRVYYTTMYAFRFYNSDSIYLYCDVKICPTSGSSNCLMDCSKRRRRKALSLDEEEDQTSLVAHTGTGMTVLAYTNGAEHVSGFGLVTLTLLISLVI